MKSHPRVLGEARRRKPHTTCAPFSRLARRNSCINRGEADLTRFAPETYTLDQHFLDRPGNDDAGCASLLDR